MKQRLQTRANRIEILTMIAAILGNISCFLPLVYGKVTIGVLKFKTNVIYWNSWEGKIFFVLNLFIFLAALFRYLNLAALFAAGDVLLMMETCYQAVTNATNLGDLYQQIEEKISAGNDALKLFGIHMTTSVETKFGAGFWIFLVSVVLLLVVPFFEKKLICIHNSTKKDKKSNSLTI